MKARIVRVAVPAPLYSLFDYLLPEGLDAAAGARVRVPFGRAHSVGLVVSLDVESDCAPDRIRPLEAVLDPEPLLAPGDLAFLRWVADYYHHPVGEVLASALPVRLRRGEAALAQGESCWSLTPAGVAQAENPPPRAPRQAEILRWLAQRPQASAPQATLRASFDDPAAVLVLRNFLHT